MKIGSIFLVVSYKDWWLLLVGVVFVAIGLGVVWESRMDALSMAVGCLAALAGLFIPLWGSRFSVAIARRDGVLVGPLLGRRWLPAAEIRAVVVTPGGEGPIASCAVRLDPTFGATWSAAKGLNSDSFTWAGGRMRALRLAAFLGVAVEEA